MEQWIKEAADEAEVMAEIVGLPMSVTISDLDHSEREDLADELSERGYRVEVHRFGSGNGAHSGRIGGCGVEKILITRKL